MTGKEICENLDNLSAESADFDTILKTAIELLHNSEPDFHWTGIYELYADDMLWLGPFWGAPTEHVFIASGQGVCGSAIAYGQIDIDSHNLNAFHPEIEKKVQQVADWLAEAYERTHQA